jgi:uncharacterized protein (UPF0335 family)
MSESNALTNTSMDEVSGRLKSLCERIERIITEEKALRNDKKEIFSEAKGLGFDVKIIRSIIKERASDIDDLREESMLMEMYRRSMGMPNPHGIRADVQVKAAEELPPGSEQKAA